MAGSEARFSETELDFRTMSPTQGGVQFRGCFQGGWNHALFCRTCTLAVMFEQFFTSHLVHFKRWHAESFPSVFSRGLAPISVIAHYRVHAPSTGIRKTPKRKARRGSTGRRSSCGARQQPLAQKKLALRSPEPLELQHLQELKQQHEPQQQKQQQPPPHQHHRHGPSLLVTLTSIVKHRMRALAPCRLNMSRIPDWHRALPAMWLRASVP